MVDETPRKSLRPFIVLAVVLTLIGTAFGVYAWHNSFFASTDDAEIDGSLYSIAAQINGRVTLVLVDDNQHVSAGQLLVQLDDRDQQVAVLKAQAAQALADVAQDQAQMALATASVTQAQNDYDRFIAVNPRATTRQQVDAATEAVEAAKARLAAAGAAVQSGQANLAAAAAAAALADARLQLSYTQIIAPAAGHVAMKTVEPGNVVSAGTAMMSLVGDDVWITANYKETQLPGIHLGATATVAVDAVPGVTFKAKVDSIQYGTGAVFSLLPAQNATGNYIKVIQRVPVKLVFTDDEARKYMLAPGMSAEPAIRIAP